MPPPTREQVNALIMRLKDTTSSGGLWVLMPEVVQVLTALQAENDRLRAQASPAWVAIKDRKPTKEDADQHGDILGLWPDRKHATIQWHHFADGRGSLGSYWQRLPAPPESAADRQRREDEEAFQKFMANGACKIDRCIWEAALAHARKEATP